MKTNEPKHGIYLEAPNNRYIENPNDWIFLGGSITGAVDWQKETARKLLPYFNIINPRRAEFDIKDENFDKIQIPWEFNYLNKCKNILFYFSNETLAPITLFEFGKELGKIESLTYFTDKSYINHPQKNIYICIHPEYKRKNDVLIQTELAAPELLKDVTFDLDIMIQKIIGYKINQ